jgi:hypothetical protein
VTSETAVGNLRHMSAYSIAHCDWRADGLRTISN